jgi:hypothetical protein
LRIATGLLGCRYGITDLFAKKSSASDIVHTYALPLLMRAAFASQIRWHVRRALTVGNVGYALDLAKFSLRAVLGSRYSFGATQWKHSH